MPLKEPVEGGFQEEGGWEPGLSRRGWINLLREYICRRKTGHSKGSEPGGGARCLVQGRRALGRAVEGEEARL